MIVGRHRKRAYLDRAVPHGVLTDVLLAAGQAPSSRNTQPWRVGVLTGGTLEVVMRTLREAFDRGEPAQPDVADRLPLLDPVAAERARDALSGALIVSTLAVGYPDESAPVNRFVPQRARLEEYTEWCS
ncbi:nitroreductase family protein [Kitasatospora sp. GP82]|uniref:nitroreductase family protein n=1 Tax=Kitasatospora sp. GP82 TaxID=3035089 RepID=UPI0024743335|nr:nitroreductase family protein [Kitasatospora sp. GP82]